MATFVRVTSPTGQQSYVINLDRITYLQESKSSPGEKTIIHFDGENSLTVSGSALEVVGSLRDF